MTNNLEPFHRTQVAYMMETTLFERARVNVE